MIFTVPPVATTLDKLREHWLLVERLVSALMKKEELAGDEMRAIYDEHRSTLPAGKG